MQPYRKQSGCCSVKARLGVSLPSTSSFITSNKAATQSKNTIAAHKLFLLLCFSITSFVAAISIETHGGMDSSICIMNLRCLFLYFFL